jgi:uncharacterized repeat protein (TIGR03803 family)
VLALSVALGFVAAAPAAHAQKYAVLHTFKGGNDGVGPGARLLRDSAGNLYGTTDTGGSFNGGTVFKIDTKNIETVLYSFTNGNDGGFPTGGVVRDSEGNLYGTTDIGNGNIFKIDAAGHETTLYEFKDSPDGFGPYTGVIRDSDGNLYGTTIGGGVSGNGAVFKLDSSGIETVLYSFAGGSDGSSPASGLSRDAAGNLYGSTVNGGGSGACPNGCGIVFKVDKNGIETVLHTFSGSDGQGPTGPLTRDTKGNLYGTTQFGGASGNGTVYKLDKAGKETVLYSFPSGAETIPVSGVIRDTAGNLYGTTELGGVFLDGSVFKLNTAGKLTTLHSFQAKGDGAFPFAGVIQDAAGNLYGTANEYGDTRCDAPFGCGTVFKITQ